MTDSVPSLGSGALGTGAGLHGAPAPGPACAELMGSLEAHPLSRLLWRRLKPLVLGKLLFTPNTNFTRQLMAQVGAGVSWAPPSTQGAWARPEGGPCPGRLPEMGCGSRVLKKLGCARLQVEGQCVPGVRGTVEQIGRGGGRGR